MRNKAVIKSLKAVHARLAEREATLKKDYGFTRAGKIVYRRKGVAKELKELEEAKRKLVADLVNEGKILSGEWKIDCDGYPTVDMYQRKYEEFCTLSDCGCRDEFDLGGGHFLRVEFDEFILAGAPGTTAREYRERWGICLTKKAIARNRVLLAEGAEQVMRRAALFDVELPIRDAVEKLAKGVETGKGPG